MGGLKKRKADKRIQRRVKDYDTLVSRGNAYKKPGSKKK